MTSPNWLSLASAVPKSERAKMLAAQESTPSTTTDPVAAELIDAAQRAMDMLDEAAVALDEAIWSPTLDRARLGALSYTLRTAQAVADSRVERLCVWAASAGGKK